MNMNMSMALKGVHVYLGIETDTGLPTNSEELYNLEVFDGVIKRIEKSHSNACGIWIAPGLLDVQVNGGGGAHFTDNPSIDSIKNIIHTHQKLGTTNLYPTMLSCSDQLMLNAVDSLLECFRTGNDCGILGLHLEGPFFAPTRHGAHHTSYIRAYDQQLMNQIVDRIGGAFSLMVTLAPELITSDQIECLKTNKIILFGGHTEANTAEMQIALKSGLDGVTHLHNAMPPMTGRNPGPIGVALDSKKLYATIIADGFHVDPIHLRIAATMLGQRLLLISDAMAPCGTNENKFDLDGRTVTHHDGRLLDERGVLCGTVVPLFTMVRRMHELGEVTFEHALAMASRNVAKMLGIQDRFGTIASDRIADMIIGNIENELVGVISNGKWIRCEKNIEEMLKKNDLR